MTYTREDAVRALSRVYDRVPAIDCKGRCADSCTSVAVTAFERQRITEGGGPELPPMLPPAAIYAREQAGDLPVCPALSALGLCTVYERRPLVCRAFGAAVNMPCEHGCQPARWLSVAELALLLGEVLTINRRLGLPDAIDAPPNRERRVKCSGGFTGKTSTPGGGSS